MKVIKLENLSTLKGVPFYAKKWLALENLEVVYIKLKSGEEVPEHTSDFNVIFIVLEGKGVFYMNKEEVCLEKYHLLPCNKGELHGFRNPHKEDLVVLVIKHK